MNEVTIGQSRISVVLATYNGATYLPQLLDSLCQQTVLPFEIVACDDKSTDNTVEILTNYCARLPIQIHSNKESLGVIKNFQKGVTLCTGDYVAFCDQDDVWLPEKLAQSIAEIRKIDGSLPAMVFTDLTVVDQDLNLIAVSYWQHRRLAPQKETFASLIYGNIVTGCTMLINRPMMTEVARMPGDVLMHDFWIACVAYGIGRCSFISTPTILYRQHLTNVTNNDAVTWAWRLRKNLSFLIDNQQFKFFLIPEIRQARSFADLYENKLSESKKGALSQLFALESKPPLFRKCATFLIKILHITTKKK